jgi:hypothetical protein
MAKMAIAAVLTDCFMGNQGHLPKPYQSQSLSLRCACKISRTERVSARSNRPWSNADECHCIWPRAILVQSYGISEQQKHTTVNNDHGQMPVPAALTDSFMRNQGHLLKACRSHACKTSRTELVLARWMTAIVECWQKVVFSDTWSGWVSDKICERHTCEHVTRVGEHKRELFELATMLCVFESLSNALRAASIKNLKSAARDLAQDWECASPLRGTVARCWPEDSVPCRTAPTHEMAHGWF